jgi:hypothetical protein
MIGIIAYLDGLQMNINTLQELQSQPGEELDELSSSQSVASGIPSVLRPSGGAFKRGL